MSENEHQSYFYYLIGQKIYLSLIISFLSPLFFVSSYQTWGYLVDWKEKGKKINKGGKYITQITWLTGCAVTIIRKSKPGQVSQTADSYVDELFFFRSNCVKALIWFILKIIKAHTYIPNTSSYRLKHSTVKHWSKTSSYYVQIWRLYLLLFFFQVLNVEPTACRLYIKPINSPSIPSLTHTTQQNLKLPSHQNFQKAQLTISCLHTAGLLILFKDIL